MLNLVLGLALLQTPNFQGIWKADSGADSDIQRFVEGGSIPYQPAAAARKTPSETILVMGLNPISWVTPGSLADNEGGAVLAAPAHKNHHRQGPGPTAANIGLVLIIGSGVSRCPQTASS